MPVDNNAVWEVQLARLVDYEAKHGDCNVPNRWAEDPPLGTWVATQRKYKKRLDHGEPCKEMTAVRVAKLEAFGFAWELSAAAISKQCSNAKRNDVGWEAQLAKLAAYKAAHGDCSVPQGWAEDPRLGRWVGDQRTRKRKLDHGEPSKGMTAERAAKLTSLGFNWGRKLTKLAKLTRQKRAWQKRKAKRSSEDAKSSGTSVSGAPKKRPRLQPTELAESTGHQFLDSFAELCEVQNDVQLEGLYLRRWYRVAVTRVDGAGAHLLYLDTDETEVLGLADFERRSWRVHGGARASNGAGAAGGPQAAQGLAARPRRGLPPGLQRRPRGPGAQHRPVPP
jgi:hypothetical protein